MRSPSKRQNEESNSSFWRPATIALLAVGMVAIIIIVVIYSVDWEVYLDRKIAKLMLADTGAPTRTPKDVGLRYQDVVITTEDGVNLAGWFIPSGQSRVTIIFCRGAKGNIGVWVDMLKQLHGLGYNVLAFDYRGTGLSGGEPSLLNIEKDITAAARYAKENLGRSARRIGILGVSIGAAVGINVAARLGLVNAIVADSAFSSFVEMVPKILANHAPSIAQAVPVSERVTDRYDPINNVDKVSPKPLFLIANQNDNLCPVQMAYRLYRKAKPPKSLWVVPGTGHAKAKDVFPSEYWAKVGHFFDHWLAGTDQAELLVSRKFEALKTGGFRVKVRVSNLAIVREKLPIAITIETETGQVEHNVFLEKSQTFEFTTQAKPLDVRVMRFFHVKPKGDGWELLPG